MEDSGKSNMLFNFILFVVFAGLVYVGIRLMVKSEIMYKESVTYTDKALNSATTRTGTIQMPNYSGIKDGYSQALSFFMLALGCLIVMLLLPRLQTFSITPTGVSVTLQNLQQNVNNLMQQTNTLQATSTGPGGVKPPAKTDEIKAAVSKGSGLKTDDPQKNKWGGKAERNDRKMTAVVKETKIAGFFQVSILIESTDTAKPLTGVVNFHLHPTFLNPNPIIAVRDGKAVLELRKVYGAFTVGADMDNGKTCLELDLEELPDAPAEFKLR